MAIVIGDRYLELLERFIGRQAGLLLDGRIILKLNPVGLHYVQSRIEALGELEALLDAAPVDYLCAYMSDLRDHRALEQLRHIFRLLTSLKVISILPSPIRDPTPLSSLLWQAQGLGVSGLRRLVIDRSWPPRSSNHLGEDYLPQLQRMVNKLKEEDQDTSKELFPWEKFRMHLAICFRCFSSP